MYKTSQKIQVSIVLVKLLKYSLMISLILFVEKHRLVIEIHLQK